jgi:hypothetical protein
MPRNHVRGRIRGLFYFREIVRRIAIQNHLAEFDQRKFAVRPHLGQVERIVLERRRLRLGHDLHAHAPLRKIARLDRFEKIALRVIRIFARQLRRFLPREILDALLGFEVELGPHALARALIRLYV